MSIVCTYRSYIIRIKDQEQVDDEYAASLIDSQWKTLYRTPKQIPNKYIMSKL